MLLSLLYIYKKVHSDKVKLCNEIEAVCLQVLSGFSHVRSKYTLWIFQVVTVENQGDSTEPHRRLIIWP